MRSAPSKRFACLVNAPLTRSAKKLTVPTLAAASTSAAMSTDSSPARASRESIRSAKRIVFMERPPRLRPHLSIRPLRCPQTRGRNSRLGAARRRSYAELLEQDGEQGIEHDHQENRLDDRTRRFLADALRRSADPQAVHTADDADEEREHRRFDQSDKQIVDIGSVPHAVEILQQR